MRLDDGARPRYERCRQPQQRKLFLDAQRQGGERIELGCKCEIVGDLAEQIGRAEAARGLLELSQDELAQRTSLSVATLKRLEATETAAMPSDHVVKNAQAFAASFKRAAAIAATGKLVLFGIVPRGPHTGYGYFRRGKELPGKNGGCDVDAFFERPNRATAEKICRRCELFLDQRDLCLHAGTFLAEMEQLAPEVLGAARDAFDAAGEDLGYLRLDGGAFARSPNISVHYAGMEKTKQAAMVPIDVG